MNRWLGLPLFLLSMPVFFLIRRIRTISAVKRWTNAFVFLCGFLGACLFVFGSLTDALAFILVWCVVAWVYNW
jgi:hypothetical protein